VLRTALRNVFAYRARLLMTALAVLLGVAFVSGTLIFTSTVSGAYADSAEASFTGVDVELRAARSAVGHDNGRLLGQELLARTRTLPGAATAVGSVSGFTALAGRDGRLVGEGWATTGANYDGTTGPDPRYPLIRGRAPAAEGEIAIDARTAERTGYEVGDTVRLSVSGPVRTERVTGVFATDDGNVVAGGTLTLFDTATGQRLFAEPGRYNQIDLTAAPGISPDQLRQQAEGLLPYGIEALTAAELAAEQARRNAESFLALSQLLLACAGIALFVGIFLIVNAFTMLVTQRTRELALLRAVGATRGQVTRSVLAEAAVVALAASAAGLVAGIGIGAGVRAVLSDTGSTLPDGPLVVDATTIVVSLALGVGVTLVAAWLPARRAGRISPVAALSSVHAPLSVRSLVVRNTVGAVLAVAGAVVVTGASRVVDGEPWLAAGAVLLLTGVFVLTPLLSRPFIAAAAPALRRFGVPGRLAGQNAERNPRRTAATASALTIGLTLITALTVIGAGADRAVRELAASDFVRADYIVSMAGAGPLAPDAARRLSELTEVTAVSPRREIPARVDGAEQTVAGFHTADIGRLLNLGMTEGTFTAGKTAIVDVETAAAEGWRPGDTIAITWPDGARDELAITGLYRSDFDAGVKTDVAVMNPHLDRITDTEILVKTRGGAGEAAERSLRAALGDSPAIRIKDKQDLAAEITGTVGLILSILSGMLVLAVVVAVLGVVNTLAMSVHERAREIGLLRAIGLDRAEVRRMVRLESMVISLFGGTLGVGLGIFLGWAVGRLVVTLGVDTWTLVLPWGRLALCLAAAALVGVLAALWPARRAARLTMLAAINAE
jgi:putative ABC transport system permease protein